MTDSKSQMHHYYTSRAPYYDAVYEKPERAADIAYLKQYLPERFADLAVLEVACGTGFWSQFIAHTAARLVASDADPAPLDRARQRGLVEAIEWTCADAYNLPNSLGKFDAAFAGLWFSHVPIERRSEFLSGLHRLLTPGARVILLDNSMIQCVEYPIAETDAFGNTYQHRQLKDGSIHRVLKNFPREAELHALITGFAREASYRELDNFWLFEYRCHAQPA